MCEIVDVVYARIVIVWFVTHCEQTKWVGRCWEVIYRWSTMCLIVDVIHARIGIVWHVTHCDQTEWVGWSWELV